MKKHVTQIHQMRNTQAQPSRLREISIESAVLLVLLASSIAYWLDTLTFRPDSTFYIAAARNFVEHQRFYVFVNWPSFSLAPEIEPFTEWVPGFPLFLAPFIALFENPIASAMAAQSFAIILFYMTLCALCRVVGLPLLFRLITYVGFTLITTFKTIFSTPLTETLFISTCFACGIFALLLINKPDSKKLWVAGFIALLLGSAIKIIGVFNLAWYVVPIFVANRNRLRQSFLCCTAAVLPIGLWFLRNSYYYGYTTATHKAGQVFGETRLWVPISFLKNEFFALAPPSSITAFLPVILLSLACLLLVYAERRKMVIADFFLGQPDKTLARQVSGNRAALVQIALALIFIAHFFGIWLISIVSRFNKLDDRLLAPAIAMGLILVMHSLHLFRQRFKGSLPLALALLTPICFLSIGKHVDRTLLSPFQVQAKSIPEDELWRALSACRVIDGATHFYTDRNFIHQMYASIPQRILWSKLKSVEDVENFLDVGTSTFFIFDQNKTDFDVNSYCKTDGFCFTEKHFERQGFKVYYKEADKKGDCLESYPHLKNM